MNDISNTNSIPSAMTQAKIDKDKISDQDKYSEIGSYISKGFLESNDSNDCGLENPCVFSV